MRLESACLLLVASLCIAITGTECQSLFHRLPYVGTVLNMTRQTLNTMDNIINTSSRAFLRNPVISNALLLDRDPDATRTVAEMIRSRGFRAQEFDVVTRDGYILTIQRIVNPLVSEQYRPKMKPVILQHGLMSSSVDWVVNSPGVRPAPYPNNSDYNNNNMIDRDSQEHPNSLGFYLANQGYDVFLANSRGNVYGQRHVKLNKYDPKFWAFSFDEQIAYDLPDTIKFIQRLTNHSKVGYVGHSQGTCMMFGLLSERPEYADIVEPFAALAPVTYVSNTVSPVKYFAAYTPVFSHINSPFATSNVAVEYLAPIVCGPKYIKRHICANLLFLTIGFDWDQLDESRVDAYMAHMPSGTSVKNVAHYGQEVLSGRFAHFDHGILGNQMKYKSTRPPSYDLSRIRSKSIILFIADNDWLAAPKDVARLRRELRVEPFAVHNLTEDVKLWNHIDYVYAKDAGKLVNARIVADFEHFRNT